MTRNQVSMEFDSEEAKGRVALVRDVYGPELVVNGRTVGFIDLFPCAKEGSPARVTLDVPTESDDEATVTYECFPGDADGVKGPL